MAIFRNKTSQIQNNDENRQFCTSSYVETLCRKYFFNLHKIILFGGLIRFCCAKNHRFSYENGLEVTPGLFLARLTIGSPGYQFLCTNATQKNKNPTSTVFIPSNEQCEQIVLSMTIFGNKSSQAHKNDENRGFCTSSYIEMLRRK